MIIAVFFNIDEKKQDTHTHTHQQQNFVVCCDSEWNFFPLFFSLKKTFQGPFIYIMVQVGRNNVLKRKDLIFFFFLVVENFYLKFVYKYFLLLKKRNIQKTTNYTSLTEKHMKLILP